MSPPLIIAHRGAAHAHTENTLAAFDAALDEGADGIELDLQLSADGVPIVFHDQYLAIPGTSNQRICDFRLAELQAMDIGAWHGGAPARMPTLDEVLDAYAGKTRLYLEIKQYERRCARQCELAAAVARRVVNRPIFPAEVEIKVLSFSARMINAVRAEAPRIPCVHSADTRWVMPLLRLQLPRLAGVCINIDAFKPGQAAMLAKLRQPLFAYTCNTREQLRRAVTLGIDYVISDFPARSRAWLAGESKSGI